MQQYIQKNLLLICGKAPEVTDQIKELSTMYKTLGDLVSAKIDFPDGGCDRPTGFSGT